jgi:hypothetical protein
MALTQSAWTVKSVAEHIVATCSVIGGAAADRYISTLPVPKAIDTRKPFSVIVTTGEDMTAAGTSYATIYVATSDSASVGSTGTLTDCVLGAQVTNTLDAGGTGVVYILPGVDGNVTQVLNASPAWVILPSAPRLILAVVTSADLQAAPATCTFIVTQ